jgi:hypothetical protein
MLGIGLELYRRFSRGIRFYLCRQLGAQELDDKWGMRPVEVIGAFDRKIEWAKT